MSASLGVHCLSRPPYKILVHDIDGLLSMLQVPLKYLARRHSCQNLSHLISNYHTIIGVPSISNKYSLIYFFNIYMGFNRTHLTSSSNPIFLLIYLRALTIGSLDFFFFFFVNLKSQFNKKSLKHYFSVSLF